MNAALKRKPKVHSKRQYTPKNRRSIAAAQSAKDCLSSIRFELASQKDFVEEAARSLDPIESMSEFGATASLERAARVLGRPAPHATPVSLPTA